MPTPITSSTPPTAHEYFAHLIEDPDMQILMAVGALGATAIALTIAAEGLDRIYGWIHTRRTARLPQPPPNILNSVLGLYSDFANLNDGPIPVSNKDILRILIRFAEIIDTNAALKNKISMDTIAGLEERVAIAIGRIFYGRPGGKEMIRQLHWDLGDGKTNTVGQKRLQEIIGAFLDRNDLIPPDDGGSPGPKTRRLLIPLTPAPPEEDLPDGGSTTKNRSAIVATDKLSVIIPATAAANEAVYDLDQDDSRSTISDPRTTNSPWHLRGARLGIMGCTFQTRTGRVLRVMGR